MKLSKNFLFSIVAISTFSLAGIVSADDTHEKIKDTTKETPAIEEKQEVKEKPAKETKKLAKKRSNRKKCKKTGSRIKRKIC